MLRIALICLCLALVPAFAFAWTHGNGAGFIIEAPADFLLDNSAGKLIAQ